VVGLLLHKYCLTSAYRCAHTLSDKEGVAFDLFFKSLVKGLFSLALRANAAKASELKPLNGCFEELILALRVESLSLEEILILLQSFRLFFPLPHFGLELGHLPIHGSLIGQGLSTGQLKLPDSLIFVSPRVFSLLAKTHYQLLQLSFLLFDEESVALHVIVFLLRKDPVKLLVEILQCIIHFSLHSSKHLQSFIALPFIA